MRFGNIYGPKPYEFIGFGRVHGPKPYAFIGSGDAGLKPPLLGGAVVPNKEGAPISTARPGIQAYGQTRVYTCGRIPPPWVNWCLIFLWPGGVCPKPAESLLSHSPRLVFEETNWSQAMSDHLRGVIANLTIRPGIQHA